MPGVACAKCGYFMRDLEDGTRCPICIRNQRKPGPPDKPVPRVGRSSPSSDSAPNAADERRRQDLEETFEEVAKIIRSEEAKEPDLEVPSGEVIPNLEEVSETIRSEEAEEPDLEVPSGEVIPSHPGYVGSVREPHEVLVDESGTAIWITLNNDWGDLNYGHSLQLRLFENSRGSGVDIPSARKLLEQGKAVQLRLGAKSRWIVISPRIIKIVLDTPIPLGNHRISVSSANRETEDIRFNRMDVQPTGEVIPNLEETFDEVDKVIRSEEAKEPDLEVPSDTPMSRPVLSPSGGRYDPELLSNPAPAISDGRTYLERGSTPPNNELRKGIMKLSLMAVSLATGAAISIFIVYDLLPHAAQTWIHGIY